MTKQHLNEMQQAKREKANSRVKISLKGITIKSHEHGWILKIKGDPERYYSSLQNLFKKLFSIKLSRSVANDLQQVQQEQNRCLREVKEVVSALEREINT